MSRNVVDTLDSHPSFRAWRAIDGGGQADYHVTLDDDTPESHLGSVGALVRSSCVTPGHAAISFELGSREYLQPAVDRLNEHYAPVTVRSVVAETRDRSGARRARASTSTR
ncbi:bacterio-opsin activator domain-containing protein [Halorubrum trueperi]|uniref:Bacterio-opsin activator domain-containing protein n=1 Tax=Halorubrum trueperi TaxID=2004704 RepID=A0ABD5UHE0_9EURY